ncbi:hypothetical protein SAMN02745866_03692 [Alteromonadaceae bacterium Bs31]|nr:hypothetical protein SAMN02745866_03692 [Alteromonadaceae bacterium Bs31]
MNFLKNAVILAGALTLSTSVLANDIEVTDDVSKEVKELRGFVKNGFSSDFGGKLLHHIDLSQEQLAALETGMSDIFAKTPTEGDVTMEEGIEAGVSTHIKIKELIDSILTVEQKAELEVMKAERVAKKQERAEKHAAKRAELTEEELEAKAAKKADRAEKWEAKRAEKEEKKAELTEEELAELEAKKEAWRAKVAERRAAWEAMYAEEEAAE